METRMELREQPAVTTPDHSTVITPLCQDASGGFSGFGSFPSGPWAEWIWLDETQLASVAWDGRSADGGIWPVDPCQPNPVQSKCSLLLASTPSQFQGCLELQQPSSKWRDRS